MDPCISEAENALPNDGHAPSARNLNVKYVSADGVHNERCEDREVVVKPPVENPLYFAKVPCDALRVERLDNHDKSLECMVRCVVYLTGEDECATLGLEPPVKGDAVVPGKSTPVLYDSLTCHPENLRFESDVSAVTRKKADGAPGVCPLGGGPGGSAAVPAKVDIVDVVVKVTVEVHEV